MSEEDLTPHEARYAQNMGDALKPSPKLDASFEARVMSAVYADVRAGRTPGVQPATGPWLTRRRAFATSPIAALAMAAGIAAVMFVGGRMTAPRPAPVAAVAAQVDTVHLVRFVFADSAASRVELVGDFNGWTRGASPLERVGDTGAWALTVPLTPGRHEYAFVVHRDTAERWVADPHARQTQDEFGTSTSIVTTN
jgi:hypothetical protein